jgi:hypothetical protein
MVAIGPTGRINGGPSTRHLLLLLVSLGSRRVRAASLKRPSSSKFNIDFEGDGDVALPCDFSEGDVVKEQYASKMALFSGPGFGGLNGGVRTGGCAVGRGDLPPLSNKSFTGLGLLGFSTLHMLSDGRTGKPVSPETVRFDVRMTNIRIGLAALDGNSITVELWSGVHNDYADTGVIIQSFSFAATADLVVYELINVNDVFIDCVRRIYITSQAKIFIVDDISYEVSNADDEYCGIDPSSNDTSTTDETAEGEMTATSGSHLQQTPIWVTAVACVCCAYLLWQATPGRTTFSIISLQRRQ